MGRSSLNYERSQKRLHSNQRIIWRAAKMESATRCPPDAQDRMESCKMEPAARCPGPDGEPLPDAQDQDSCQMPRTRWRAASRCPGPDGELPGWSQLPDAPDQMESCQMEPSCQDEANCQMPRRAARMKPTTRCRTSCQLKPPDTQDPYPVVGATDGHDTPPEKQDAESRDYRRGTEEER